MTQDNYFAALANVGQDSIPAKVHESETRAHWSGRIDIAMCRHFSAALQERLSYGPKMLFFLNFEAII